MSANCKLTIDLLPEFGWAIQDTPVYGPGSVFQGFVQVQLTGPISADRLVLMFRGFESLDPACISQKLDPVLFGTQHTLWESKNGSQLTESSYRFPFTIQMPLVQFPPSMDHELCKCEFRLSAYLDNVSCHRKVQYMPFTETCLLKSPLYREGTHGPDFSATLKMQALDYVPGDNLVMSLNVRGKSSVHVSTQLSQLATVLHGYRPTLTKVIASSSTKVSPGSNIPLSLPLPSNLTPSCSYSRHMSLTYKLKVVVERKGPLGGMWSSEIPFELPINIGTLGYGIRTSDELQYYTVFTQNDAANSTTRDLPVPRFMRAVEYEEALPRYEPARLPSYESTSHVPTTIMTV
ncbi:hypothetical protein DFQ28_009563 [Apophysomyces sp. BC1034]|nr:hypothetical protein DFQ30_009346 [Apophysomyces sp. BC1015]KAG0175848.1 hypothetical protein DFQ29_006955 [Apophysomyces sp. BC1021]KAG0185312.1 hypothetical protein DFQ28_009563 [Apophysomyces sp. BC1034]